MKTYWKFAALVAVIIGTLVWLAAGGIGETKTYYKTISELDQMGAGAYGKRIRVAGDVEAGSIVRRGQNVEFVLTQEKRKLRVVYSGADPLPDTFRAGAQALADGKIGADNVFQANKIQAKCASKYQAKPGQAPAPLNPAPFNKATM
jgi:cytochrome c-type biogenesis protein CcmE